MAINGKTCYRKRTVRVLPIEYSGQDFRFMSDLE